MLCNNLIFATTLFFGWLLFDSVGSLLGSPLEGVYYPLASGWLKSVPADWTNKPSLQPRCICYCFWVFGFFSVAGGVKEGVADCRINQCVLGSTILDCLGSFNGYV